MAHTLYDNKVLENKIENLLTTNIDLNNYMTIDYSLTENAGMTKVINRYTATGNVQDLAMGEGNSEEITVSFEPFEYMVGTTQGYFTYYDEQEMQDPMVVETGLQALSQQMTNDLTAKAIGALHSAGLMMEGVTWNFADMVDCIGALNYEDESGLFFLINPVTKAKLRKMLGDDLKYSEAFARTGYIGSVCGVPIIVSKAVPENEAYLATKEAVTCFVKKGFEIEQDRDPNLRQNKVWARKTIVVALTDNTKVLKIIDADVQATPGEGA